MTQKRIFSLFLAAALTANLTACGSQSGSASSSQEASAPAGVAVQVQEVTVETISTENKVSGKVTADNSVNVMVATTAKCTAVHMQAGDLVQAGDKICTLDLASTLAQKNAATITYQATVQQYNDQKAILDKQLKLASNNVSNTKALFDIGAASQLEVDNAELQLAQAEAGRANALSQLEAGMQSYKSNLEQLDLLLEHVDGQGNVISPISGTLSALYITENGYSSASTPVAVIDGAGQMVVTVYVSEALVPKLNAGDEATISIPSAGASFTGTIRSVEKSANVQTKLYTVTLAVPAEVEGLLSGMFADVTFHTDTADNAVVVPSQAILTSAGKQYVFVAEDNAARQVEVTTGLTGAGVTQVLTGLNGGEQLVIVGQAYLSDGDSVRVVSGEG